MGAIIKARNEAELATIRRTWEQTRAICFYNVIAMHGTKDYKKPQDLFLMSWEKKKADKMDKAPRNKDEAMERHRQIKLNKLKYGQL